VKWLLLTGCWLSATWHKATAGTAAAVAPRTAAEQGRRQPRIAVARLMLRSPPGSPHRQPWVRPAPSSEAERASRQAALCVECRLMAEAQEAAAVKEAEAEAQAAVAVAEAAAQRRCGSRGCHGSGSAGSTPAVVSGPAADESGSAGGGGNSCEGRRFRGGCTVCRQHAA